MQPFNSLYNFYETFFTIFIFKLPCMYYYLNALYHTTDKCDVIYLHIFYHASAASFLKIARVFDTIFWGQNKWYKNVLSFLWRGPTHHSFTFNLRFLYELKHKVCFSKTEYVAFHFRFHFIFIKVYIFVQQNPWVFGFKTSWFCSKLK